MKFQGAVVDPTKTNHFIMLNSDRNDEYMIDIFGPSFTAVTILHEVIFHTVYQKNGISTAQQHNFAFGLPESVHKNKADNAAEGSPQKVLEKEVDDEVNKRNK
jgi:hypothetical protein